jgi:hypothetical protein
MGNNSSQLPIERKDELNSLIKNAQEAPILLENREDIFQKIGELSNILFSEFNNEFLKDNFCSKIAMIYEKKLSSLNIKLLRVIHNEINSNNVNRELLLTSQYTGNNDELFEVDIFSGILDENFWNKNIQFNKKFFEEQTSNNSKNVFIPDPILLKIKNISEIFFSGNKNYYINSKHVNNLLESKNKVTENVQTGGRSKRKRGLNPMYAFMQDVNQSNIPIKIVRDVLEEVNKTKRPNETENQKKKKI